MRAAELAAFCLSLSSSSARLAGDRPAMCWLSSSVSGAFTLMGARRTLDYHSIFRVKYTQVFPFSQHFRWANRDCPLAVAGETDPAQVRLLTLEADTFTVINAKFLPYSVFDVNPGSGRGDRGEWSKALHPTVAALPHLTSQTIRQVVAGPHLPGPSPDVGPPR